MPKRSVILLVDDELAIRKFVAELLHRTGYLVVSASSGPDALTASAEWSGRIDLLLSDIELGGAMSGIQLAEHLEALHPNLRVLLMSGSPMASVSLGDAGHFIRKPFTPAALINKIKEVLPPEADSPQPPFRLENSAAAAPSPPKAA